MSLHFTAISIADQKKLREFDRVLRRVLKTIDNANHYLVEFSSCLKPFETI